MSYLLYFVIIDEDLEDFNVLTSKGIDHTSEIDSNQTKSRLSQHTQFLRSMYSLKAATQPLVIGNKELNNVTVFTIKAALNVRIAFEFL